MPQCVVFYNGQRDAPEEQILKLSDAFQDTVGETDIELKVRMLNINYGHNQTLMERCRVLKEYAKFIDIARAYIAEKREIQDALNTAINYCIDHNILSDFLKKYRAEVLGMILEEFDVEKYERSIKAEGIEIGLQQAEKRIEQVNRLTDILLEQNRIADLKHAVKEPEYQEQLLRELDV